MPLFKEMPFKQKKSKSLNLAHEMFSKAGLYPKANRNSFTSLTTNSPPNQKVLCRSSSHADDETVLLNSIGREDMSSLRKVLEAGKVDINIIRNGMEPIHHACVTGNVKIVKLLLGYGSNIDSKTKDGNTPIKIAVLHGHFELAEFLIAMGGTDSEIVDGVQ